MTSTDQLAPLDVDDAGTFVDDLEPDDLEPDTAPEPFDPLDALTIAELDAGSRLLKASLVGAVAEKTADYEKALAIIGYLHARRTDRLTRPDELLRRFTAMRYSELSEALASYAPVAEPDPTAPERA